MNPIIELLRQNQQTIFVDEDGLEDPFELLPALTEQELAAFEASLPCPLPDEIRELLRFARGFKGVLEEISFTDRFAGFEEGIFPHAISLAGDGFGNFWIVDLTSTSWGSVFYVCHDAPVVVYQAEDLRHFIQEALRSGNKPWKSEIDTVHEELSNRIWRDNPGVLSYEECLTLGDPELRVFAESLDHSWRFIDLRSPKLGDGFSWGRYGARTTNKRFGDKLIFAYQKKSLWRRFLDALR